MTMIDITTKSVFTTVVFLSLASQAKTKEILIQYFAGIISRLPYLKDLGVGAVWLSPFYKSPMKDFGYDVSDYRQVDPLFGTLKDFDTMIKEAHDLGIKRMKRTKRYHISILL